MKGNVIKESYSDSVEFAGKCKHSKAFNSEKLRDIKNKLPKFMYYEIIYVSHVNISAKLLFLLPSMAFE
jgi:uncharacterized protein YpbB